MNTSAVSPQAPRGRVQFVLLATLFFLPLLLSYALYFWFPQFRPTGSTNYGRLIDPARPLPSLSFVDARGATLDQTVLTVRWSYVRLAGASCDQACIRDLVLTRQVRLAQNEKRSRVQRVLVLADAAAVATVAEQLKAEHPDLRVLAQTGAPGQRLSDLLQPADAAAHLVDPNGNWLLFYPAGGDTQTDFRGLQKDLRKLLRLSQIG